MIVTGTEGYELLKLAQDSGGIFDRQRKRERERGGSVFILCQTDWTRWTKEKFHQKFGSVTKIPTLCKQTFYVGRGEMGIIMLK